MSGASVPGEPPVLDVEHLRLVCGNDPEFEREIIGDYLTQAESHVARLATAVAARDANDLRFVAHALVGSSRSLGAVAFGEACAVLEALGKGGDLSEAPQALARLLPEWERLQATLRIHRERSAA